MKINLTPHAIHLNSGEIFEPSGDIARVSANYSGFVDGVCQQVFGEVTGLPEPVEGVKYIVSALVLAASDRDDLVAPATGHPECRRDEQGRIISVPGFVSK